MPTFPAFEDAEPPPRTPRQRLLRAGVVLGVLALGTAAALAATTLRDRTGDDAGGPGSLVGGSASALPSASDSAAATPGSVEGILWYDSERLAVAGADGSGRQRISRDFPTTQQRFHASVSPDGRSVVTDDGFLVTIGGTALATPIRVLPADVTEAYIPSSAWADGGRRIAVDMGTDAGPRIGLVTLATGVVADIGPGTAPAGDPRAAAVVYAAGLRELPDPRPDVETFLDTDRIEYLNSNQFAPPTVMLRKADLLRLMSLPPSTPATFASIGFAPDGEHLFFTAHADTRDAGPYGPTDRWAVGILTRTGQVAAFRALDPLHFLNLPVWSPGGDQLLFLDFNDTSRLTRPATQVLVWSLDGGRQVDAPRPLEVPTGVQPFSHGDCTWKPDATAVLCGDDRAWYVIALAGGGSSVAESVPGRPLAWVAPR